MKNTIYFYTGTGNSLWAAKKLSALLADETELISIPIACKGFHKTDSERTGFIFPVHIWGMPAPVVDFLERLEVDPSVYYFAVAVNAGQVAATLIQLKKILQKKNAILSAGFSVRMPSNYIPWSGADSQKKQQHTFIDALDKINHIALSVGSREKKEPEKGPLWQNILLSAIYRSSYAKVPALDKSFWTDEKCTSCGICQRICPADNVAMKQDKPQWQHRCEQCFACLQWCPDEAIQYGRVTARKKRYRHPEVTLQDMLGNVPNKIR